MENESEQRGSGSAGGRKAGKEAGNPSTPHKQPIGGGTTSRAGERGGRAGGEKPVSPQPNADADGASRQTSTAQDEEGQA